MNDRHFDRMAKTLGRAESRRAILKTLLGIGAVTGASGLLRDVDAARRGYAGPGFPTPQDAANAPLVPPTQDTEAICPGLLCSDGCCDRVCDASGNCCPSLSIVCAGECCPKQQTECCDGVCCDGVCYDGVLCCPEDMGPCDHGGCCNIIGPRVGAR